MRVSMYAVALLGILGGRAGAAEKVEWKLEVRVCGEASGTVVKGGACWVLDPVKKTTVYEYQACAGVTVNLGILAAGAQASVMLCGTVTVPLELAGDRKAWQKVAHDRLEAALKSPTLKADLEKSLGQAIKSYKVGPVKEADPATASQLRKAIKESKKK